MNIIISCSSRSWGIGVEKLLLCLFSLLGGLPKTLLEFEDLSSLEAVESHLLAELLVKGSDGLLKGGVIRGKLELLFELGALFREGRGLDLLLVDMLLELADLVLLSDEERLERLKVRGD